MRFTLTFLLSLWLPLSFAGMSSSAPKPVDYFAQLSSLTELISVDAEGGFSALQNRTLSPELLGGVVILTDFRPDWITYTRALRLGLADQGWDLMTPEPSEDHELSLKRGQAMIDAHRTAGKERILLIALEDQANNAIELARDAPDLRLLIYKANGQSSNLEAIKNQVDRLGKAPTVELYSGHEINSEGAKRNKAASGLRLANYHGRAFFGPSQPNAALTTAETKRILGAIKTLIIEQEPQKS